MGSREVVLPVEAREFLLKCGSQFGVCTIHGKTLVMERNRSLYGLILINLEAAIPVPITTVVISTTIPIGNSGTTFRLNCA